MRAKPVVLPPPNWVRRPKTETWSLPALYRPASLSRSSSLEMLGRLGCRMSLWRWKKQNVSQPHIRHHDIWSLLFVVSSIAPSPAAIISHALNISIPSLFRAFRGRWKVANSASAVLVLLIDRRLWSRRMWVVVEETRKKKGWQILTRPSACGPGEGCE